MAVNAMMVSVYYLSIFAGSTISVDSAVFTNDSRRPVLVVHAVIVGTGGLLILLFARRLRRELIHGPVPPT